jgi:hypothetical protein
MSITSTTTGAGVVVGLEQDPQQLGLQARDFGLDVAAGNYAGLTGGRAFGFNPATPTTQEMIWAESGTAYPWPSAASVRTVSSSSALDTAAGTGARTVQIVGLDASFNVITEVVTLNGITAVTTVNAYYRINDFAVLTAGTGGTNAGIVYVGSGTVTLGKPATVLFSIDTGMGGGLQAMYTVPAGKKLYLASFLLSFSAAGILYLWARANGSVFRVLGRFPAPAFALSIPLNYKTPVPAGTDIYLSAAAVTGTIIASARFEFFLGDA